MQGFWLTNSFTRSQELFVPRDSGKVSLYVCGITPYDFAHIGHGRCYVTFDLLARTLTYLGYEVTYVRNFTDIDDKTINRAARELGSPYLYAAIAQQYIDAFSHDIEKLGCVKPEHEPRVTQTISEIIAFIEGLIAQGKAYVAEGDVYYSVRSFASYGELSGRDIEDLIAGARVELNSKKRDPLDFALWKAEEAGTFWDSPWGAGRPGWHIECSAMAQKFLGGTVDIHGGGMDLLFPHHENERAQSEGLTGTTFVRYWMHVAFVRINKEKMSKSLGNFFTLRDVFKDFDPMVVRYYYATHHYTVPLDFTFEDLKAAQTTYERLVRLFENTQPIPCQLSHVAENPVAERMIQAMLKDLNTSAFMAAIFENIRLLQQHDLYRGQVKYLLQTILGLTLEPLAHAEIELTPEIQALIAEREAARAARDFKRADQIRDQLVALGVQLQDKKI